MRRERNIRNIIIFSLFTLVIFMGVGFAYMTQQLNVNGVANIDDASWDINIDSIEKTNQLHGATGEAEIDDSKKSVNFNVNLFAPGDSLTYTIIIKNSGNIPAKVESIFESPAYSTTEASSVSPIIFSYEDITNQKIAPGETKQMDVTISYDINATSLAPATTLNYQLTVLCSQDTNVS